MHPPIGGMRAAHTLNHGLCGGKLLNRRDFLISTAISGCLLGGARWSQLASAEPLSEVETAEGLETTRLTDTVHLITGAGGNIAVIDVTEGGPIQIDSGLAATADKMLQAVTAATGRTPGMLLNTHWHGDHTGGNSALGGTHATIVAHAQTRVRLSTDQLVDLLKSKTPASPAIALPAVTFSDTLTMRVGSEEIALTHVAPAHTDTDVFIYIKNANVLHAGDLLFNGMFPFIDYSSKGWIGGMVAAADSMLKFANSTTKIIPGHGPVASKTDLQTSRDMLHEVQSRITPFIKKGKTPAQVVAAKPLKDLDTHWGGGFMKTDVFTLCVAEGIKRHG